MKSLIEKLGLLGPVSLVSYAAAVVFAPLAYPDYNWMAQAVSDLSADTASSRVLWNQLASLYGPCGIVCCTLVCVYIAGKLTKPLRMGIYLFTVMNWVSSVGYTMFPLTGAGLPDGFQNVMHLVVTAAVVLLSIISLGIIIYAGFVRKACPSLGLWATAALILMLAGAVGTAVMPAAYFGIPERFSVFAASGFTAVLGIFLYRGFGLSGRAVIAEAAS